MYNFGQASYKTTILNNFWLRLAYKWRGGTIREAVNKKTSQYRDTVPTLRGGVSTDGCPYLTSLWVFRLFSAENIKIHLIMKNIE